MASTYQSPGVYVEEVPPLARPIAGVGTSTPAFIGIVPDSFNLPASDGQGGMKWVKRTLAEADGGAAAGKPYFVTSWTQYTRLFGDLVGNASDPAITTGGTAIDVHQRNLAHAVFGFFDNGGGGCYVVRIAALAGFDLALKRIAALDKVTMVAAPGIVDASSQEALTTHCETLLDRVAILDAAASDDNFELGDYTGLLTANTTSGGMRPRNSTYAAVYFPWLQVQDPAEKLIGGTGGLGLIHVPPSGHIAGIYARSDAERGVFKAPANEAVRGVTGLRYALSRTDQNELNDAGVNIIRPLVGAIRVWGARTVGGVANGQYTHISTRRYFNYLRESIEQGTQFVVFEPNSPALWERIKRSVGGFLIKEWRSGALFGVSAEKAFYVKCDADTNPADVREAGQVVTEIGVAIVKPAEFVIFRIQQNAGS